ncbi:RDD family protein [Lewinella sp. IMCC34183]|uniref:RDD family protein n=1 Tax=Lewinella sp. IMCC34183 TaxID=2248762 RepID=UPI0013006873|nr:RDD family protein [Lewinella sp. IMCC34183]
MTSQAIQELPDPTTVPTAGFVPRLAAFVLDFLLVSPLVYGMYYFQVEQPMLYGVIACWLVYHLYKPLTEAHFGCTAGKAALRLRVVTMGGRRRITYNQSFIRYLPWAISAFITLFVYIRVMQSPSFAEVDDVWSYSNYINEFPLQQNFFVSLGNNLPTFSAVWMIMDPWNRTLHDRWARTFVVFHQPAEAGETE